MIRSKHLSTTIQVGKTIEFIFIININKLALQLEKRVITKLTEIAVGISGSLSKCTKFRYANSCYRTVYVKL